MRALLLFVVLLAGCSMRPYMEVGAGYVFMQDGPHLSHCKWPGVIGVGVADEKQSISWQHNSYIDCGQPFGESYDNHTESIMYKRRFYITR